MKIAKTTLIGLLGLTTASYMWAGDAGEPSLLQAQKILAEKKIVDLPHAFAPGIPPMTRISGRKAQPRLLV
jgi:hypothetical protein